MTDIKELKDTELENVTGGNIPAASGAMIFDNQTEYDVILMSVGPKKFDVVQTVNTILKCGYKDALSIVESVPVVIREAITKDEADQICNKFALVGAICKIQ